MTDARKAAVAKWNHSEKGQAARRKCYAKHRESRIEANRSYRREKADELKFLKSFYNEFKSLHPEFENFYGTQGNAGNETTTEATTAQ